MKDVIEMAKEVGLRSAVLLHMYGKESALCDSEIEELRQLERFAELVRADERNSWPAEMEAMERQINILTDALAEERNECAKVCEELVPDMSRTANDASVWDVATFDCAAAIRARGSNT